MEGKLFAMQAMTALTTKECMWLSYSKEGGKYLSVLLISKCSDCKERDKDGAPRKKYCKRKRGKGTSSSQVVFSYFALRGFFFNSRALFSSLVSHNLLKHSSCLKSASKINAIVTYVNLSLIHI